MTAIDTIGLFATVGAASPFPTALAAQPGDSLAIRNFPAGQKAGINAVIISAGGGQKVRVQSPLLHDNVTGLTWQPGEVPSQFLVPRDIDIDVQPLDQVQVFSGIAAAGTITGALQVYYAQLPGVAARLHSWGDIAGNVKYVKSFEVDLGAVAVGAWTDTLFTATENQLHAGADYAILGYDVNPAVDVVGFKGAFTGNLRVCGPGPVSTLDITEYFIRMSEYNHLPYIPVFNANDRFACYVSAANHAAIAGGAASVYPIVAQLATPVTP
jgi:hypothetical protein